MCKLFYKIFLLIILLSTLNSTTYSQSTDYQPEDFLLDNANLGTDFWVAMPQNGATSESLKEQDIALYISSPYQTTALVENEALGISKSVSIQPYSISRVNIGTNLEVTESEKVTHNGIHITAPKPVMVYAVNVKQYSGEGFMALPTHALGKKYFHCSYYDFNGPRNFDDDHFRSGGFVVVASQNSTHIQIKINGVGADVATTEGGSTIGTMISKTLQAGDTYDLRGNGQSYQKFDISGTEITSDKPIGVISYHERTMIPQDCYEDRDNLIDMLLPVDKWGKEYISIQMDREKQGNQGDGDMFRLMACESNTEVDCNLYKLADYSPNGSKKATLSNPGSFETYDDPGIIAYNNKKTALQGISRWQSTKPFQLIQYAFSYPWDDDRNWSPMMIVIPPLDQFVSNTMVMAPDLQGINMTRTSLTLLAVGDPNDPNNTLLKSIEVDGIPLTTISSPSITSSNIEGTNIYWTRLSLDVDNKVHVITSDTKIAGYHCMLGYANSLGWPIGMGTNVINDGNEDIVEPILEKSSVCGNYTVTATESGIDDKGLSKIIFLESASNNYEMELENPEEFIPNEKIASQKFYLNIIDRDLPATAAYAVLDRAGNITYDTVEFVPETAEFDTEGIAFGSIRINNEISMNTILTNTSNETLTINEIMLKDSSVFTLDDIDLPQDLEPQGKLTFTINYKPVKESASQAYKDTLLVYSECNDYSVTMNGYCIAPHIAIEDFHFGNNIEIYTSKCIEDINNEGLRIMNSGSDTLKINNIEGINPPFTISEPTDPAMPFNVPPGEEVYLKSICFVPDDTVKHSIEVTLQSDAAGTNDDNTAIITAQAWKKPEDAVEEYIISDNILEIIPNPASDEDVIIKFYANGTRHASIKVFSASGHEVTTFSKALTEQGWNSVRIETGSLVPGVYLIRLISGSKVYSGKLIIF